MHDFFCVCVWDVGLFSRDERWEEEDDETVAPPCRFSGISSSIADSVCLIGLKKNKNFKKIRTFGGGRDPTDLLSGVLCSVPPNTALNV